jgi:hypothetical protein
MLIATVLLLSILAFLSYNAISVQHAQAENFYKIKDETSITSGYMGRNPTKMSDHIVTVKQGV